MFTLLPVSVSGSSLAGLELPMPRVNRARALFGEPSTEGKPKTKHRLWVLFFKLFFFFSFGKRRDDAHLSR